MAVLSAAAMAVGWAAGLAACSAVVLAAVLAGEMAACWAVSLVGWSGDWVLRTAGRMADPMDRCSAENSAAKWVESLV
jgi:hydroxymethylglutaryl-CoA reductase